MKKTSDQWWDVSWNPVTGCSPISEGCNHCYARRMAQRLRGRCGYPTGRPFRVTFHPKRLKAPLRWRKPRRIFTCSMGDLFHEDVPAGAQAKMWGIMAACPQHTFIILTKRVEAMKIILTSSSCFGLGELPNVWLGVTVESKKHMSRVKYLAETPAAIRLVSVEPMLESVWFGPLIQTVDWMICGAETGTEKRFMQPKWANWLRIDCEERNIPFFFKKNSEGNRLLAGREWNGMPEAA